MNEAPTADGGPGFLAFLAFFLLAIALWFLMRNMNARMRRMSYRQQAAHRGKDDPQVGPGSSAPGATVRGPVRPVRLARLATTRHPHRSTRRAAPTTARRAGTSTTPTARARPPVSDFGGADRGSRSVRRSRGR